MNKVVISLVGFLFAACTLTSGTATAPSESATLPGPHVTTISAPDVEEIVTDFLSAWNEREYEFMYEMLSPQSQESISKVSFLERYEDIWSAAHLTGIEFEIVSSLLAPDDAQVRYRITLKSAIVRELTRETWLGLERDGELWGIDWTDQSILPELTPDSGLLLAPIIPNRANIYDRNGRA
ncbi:MAG: hypothetical protein KAH97_02260, partial [Anaerolineales bacterium]|nr:hypothetical protein [Anaerolineales bacterium]